MTARIDLKYGDFNKICRLCCKRSKKLTSIYQTTEDTSDFPNDTVADNDSIAAMLLKLGLSVMIKSFFFMI